MPEANQNPVERLEMALASLIACMESCYDVLLRIIAVLEKEKP